MMLAEASNSDKQILCHLDAKVGTAKTFIKVSSLATSLNYKYLHLKGEDIFISFLMKVLKSTSKTTNNRHSLWKLEPPKQYSVYDACEVELEEDSSACKL
jgi:hypothetical protein